MKLIYTLFFLPIVCFDGQAQESVSVEKSILSLNLTFGANLSYEKRLAPRMSSRSELGLDYLRRGEHNLFLPVLAHDLRWYYNLYRREKKSKNIKSNSADYASLYLKYRADWFVLPSDQASEVNSLSIIPTWGLRRQIASSAFSFEFSTGFGFRATYYNETEFDPEFLLLVRFGYRLFQF